MDENGLNTIYTAGYARLREPAHLLDLANTCGAVVIDVRLKPWTSFKGWSQTDLVALLGERYRWVESLGNVNYRGGPVQLKDAARGSAEVIPILREQSIILLCGCADPNACHRGVVARLLADQTGCPIEHLLADDPARPHQLSLFQE